MGMGARMNHQPIFFSPNICFIPDAVRAGNQVCTNRLKCLNVKEEEVDEHYYLHSGA
jgi:hypothetical protein